MEVLTAERPRRNTLAAIVPPREMSRAMRWRYDARMMDSEIAEELGVDVSTVVQWRKANNLTPNL